MPFISPFSPGDAKSADDYLALIDDALLYRTPFVVLVCVNPNKDIWQPVASVSLDVLRRIAVECVQSGIERVEREALPGKFTNA